ncbi:MAG: sodium:solute symporter family protein [Spirochaetales bacterium]|nr:sodium:solute symporter family protein [Spirochaetales bacterium]MCF7939216.1 sodium:solute symporter family protein [Spirochaetales bacterium]
MSGSDWVVLLPFTLGYVVIALFLGLRASKGQMMNKIEGWAVASRNLGIFVMFFLTGAGAVSAYTFLGSPGWAYSKGSPALYVVMYLTLGYFVAFFFLGRVYKVGKKKHFVTQAEVLRNRYNSKYVGSIGALIGILGCLGYGITQAMGAGFILNFASGDRIPFWGGVVLVFGVMVIYITVSGLRAIGWTNSFQGVLMLFVSVIGGIMIIRHFWPGGTTELFSALQSDAPEFLTIEGGGWDYRTWTTGVIASALGIVCWPTFWVMWMGSKSLKVVRRTISLLPLYWFVLLPMILVGFAAILKIPGVTPADSIAMEAAAESLPLGITGLMFAATLAAAMSSAEILILNASLQFVQDMVQPFRKKKLKDAESSTFSRLMVIPFALIIIVVGVTQPSTLVGMLLMTYGLLVQLFPTIFSTFYMKNSTKAGTATGLTAGLIVAILFTQVWPNPLSIHAGVWGLAVNFILLIVVSKFTNAPPAENVDPFFNLDEFKDEEVEPVAK